MTYRGEIFQVEDATLGMKPVQSPHPPIWMGGHHPNAVRRAAVLADGWMGAGGSTTAAFATSVPLLRAALEESGRDPTTFPISKRVFLSVHARPDVAEAEVRRWFSEVYRNPALTTRPGCTARRNRCANSSNRSPLRVPPTCCCNPVTRYDEQIETLAEIVGLA